MQTLGNRQSQLTLDQSDTSRGLMPMTSSCGTVIGSHATKERSPLSCFFCVSPPPPISGLAVLWPSKSLHTLLLVHGITADGCVITLLL